MHWLLSFLCSQILFESHSTQWYLLLPWQHISLPWHSVHLLFRFLWGHIHSLSAHSVQWSLRFLWIHRLVPPHSTHLLLICLWMQIEPPLHSIHLDLRFLWGHMDAPLQSTHWLLIFLWIHIPELPHFTHIDLIFLWIHTPVPQSTHWHAWRPCSHFLRLYFGFFGSTSAAILIVLYYTIYKNNILYNVLILNIECIQNQFLNSPTYFKILLCVLVFLNFFSL